jgi:hypothetical protein
VSETAWFPKLILMREKSAARDDECRGEGARWRVTQLALSLPDCAAAKITRRTRRAGTSGGGIFAANRAPGAIS